MAAGTRMPHLRHGGDRLGADARRAARSRSAHRLARVGLAARSAVYLLLAWVALLLVLNKPTPEADQRGALELLAGHVLGDIVLWVVAIGLALYALWRYSEVIFGAAGATPGHGGGARARSMLRALAYSAIAATAFSVVAGTTKGSNGGGGGGGNGGKNQAGQEEEFSARLMRHIAGRWLVAAIGVGVAIAGVVLFIEAVTRKFAKYLDLRGTARATRDAVLALGVVGGIARGIVFGVAGGFVLDAAVRFDPAKARGLDAALRGVRAAPHGGLMLAAIACGLAIFGCYAAAEARWRKV